MVLLPNVPAISRAHKLPYSSLTLNSTSRRVLVPADYHKDVRHTALLTTIYSGHTTSVTGSIAAKSLLSYNISTINSPMLADFFELYKNFLCKRGFHGFKGKVKEKSAEIL